MQKKVACVVPPFYRLIETKNNRLTPSMHYAAEILHRKGHNVIFINGDYEDETFDYSDRLSMTLNNWLYTERFENGHESFDKIVDQLRAFEPDYVIIGAGDVLIPTVETGSAQACSYLANKIKDSLGFHVVCVGYGFMLKYANKELQAPFDAIIIGEGENQIVEIVENGKRSMLPTEWNQKLDLLPILTDEYLTYKPEPTDWDYIMSMRGCPHHCTFCMQPTLRAGVVHTMSPKRFAQEIRYRILNYGVYGFYFLDMIFLPDSSPRTYEMLDELVQIKKEFPQFNWWAEARGNASKLWSNDIVHKMKLSGCRHLKFGVEMTNNDMLKTVQKGINYEQVKDSFKLIQSNDINTTAYVLLGCPGFKDDDYKQMWYRFKELNADNYVININVPYMGTKLYDQMHEELSKFKIYASGEEDFTHTSLIMKKFWNISDETINMYFSLQGEKDDSNLRKYKRKIVDRNYYIKTREIRYLE